MDKKFIKSMVAAVAGLGLASSCSMMGKDSHKCGGKNSCKGKSVEDSHKCAANKCSSNKCSSKKAEVKESNTCGAKNGCAASKDSTSKGAVKSSKKAKAAN